MNKKIIAWDLGATKCTAGIVDYDNDTNEFTCKKKYSLKLADATSLDDLIYQLESSLNVDMAAADAVCIAGAGHYDGAALQLQNGYPYPMQIANVAAKRKWKCHDVIHDYSPIVCATFTSYMQQPGNIKLLKSGVNKPYGRRVAFGIGTSLGLKDGVLFPDGNFWLGQNEAGFIGVNVPPHANQSDLQRHEEFIRFMQSTLNVKQQLTFENILSGRGTVSLHQFLYPQRAASTPEEIGANMCAGKTPELLDLFAWYIGLFIGTVELIFMPEGGVWITGGVTMNHLYLFDLPAIFAGIEASPAYQTQRLNYPLGVMSNDEHALIGCGYYAVKRLDNFHWIDSR